jgi:tetratricopeptide (TPR) repeat protein
MKRSNFVKRENYLDKINMFYQQNPQKFKSIFLLIIFAVAIIFIVTIHIKSKKAKIIEAYLTATNTYDMQMNSQTPNYQKIIDDFNKVVEMKPDSEYAVDSLFIIADAYYHLEDYDNSISTYSILIKRAPNKSDLNYQAKLAYSNVLKEAEKIDEAITVLRGIINDGDAPTFAKAPAKINLALIYFNNDEKEKAREMYDLVIENYSETFWAEQALLYSEGL